MEIWIPAVAALIAALLGSVSGGIITGHFSLRAVREQREADREIARESRLLDTRITLGGEFITLAYRVYGGLLEPDDSEEKRDERHRLILLGETLRLVLDPEASEAVNKFTTTVTSAAMARWDDDPDLPTRERSAAIKGVYTELGDLQQMLNRRLLGSGPETPSRIDAAAQRLEADARPELPQPHAGID